MTDRDSTDIPEDSVDETTTAATAESHDEAAEAPEPAVMELEVKIDSVSSCERHVTVTIARDEVERYYSKAFDELMPKAEVPGFRPGRAPRKLVENRFRRQMGDQVKSSLIVDAMAQVSDQQKLAAISEPDFDFEAIKIPEDGPFTFEFGIEVRPEFELPQWRGLKLKRKEVSVSDEDVDKEVLALQTRMAKWQPTEEPAAPDDLLHVELSAKHGDRVTLEPVEQRVRVRPTLSFPDAELPSFDELMTGVKAGETRTAEVKVSADAAREELRDQTLQVTFKVNEVRRLDLPKLSDAYVSKHWGVDSEEELRSTLKIVLDQRAQYEQRQLLRSQITKMLTADADWDLPQAMLRRQAGRELARRQMEMEANGLSDEQIQQISNRLKRQVLEYTKTALQEHFILERIAEAEEVDASEEDYTTEIGRIAAQRSESPRSVRARFEKRGQMDALRNQIVENKVIDRILDEAEFESVGDDEDSAERTSWDQTTAVSVSLVGEEPVIPEAKHAGDATDLQQPTDHS